MKYNAMKKGHKKTIGFAAVTLALTLSLGALAGCTTAPQTASASSKAAPVSSSAASQASQESSSATTDSKITGAYGEQRSLTQEDKALFDEVMATVDNGKTYEPITVATQVVAGTNYRYHVKVTEGDKEYEAYVVIYQPLGDKEPEFTKEEEM